MSDRCMIGFANSDKTVTSVYCHWNGDPKDAGVILLKNYNTAQAVQQLLKLGYLSVLGNSLDESIQMVNPHEPADTNRSHRAFKSHGERFGVSYLYLFTDSGWLFATPYESGWTPLAEVLEHWE